MQRAVNLRSPFLVPKNSTAALPLWARRSFVSEAHIQAELEATRRVKALEEKNARDRETLLRTTPAPPQGKRGDEAPGQPTRLPSAENDHTPARPSAQ
jgi:hypothetical protein